jgi:hypothetical protein
MRFWPLAAQAKFLRDPSNPSVQEVFQSLRTHQASSASIASDNTSALSISATNSLAPSAEVQTMIWEYLSLMAPSGA